jgi:hypothetical protein
MRELGKNAFTQAPLERMVTLRAFPCAVSLAQDVNRTANVLLLHEDECKKALENRVLQRQ